MSSASNDAPEGATPGPVDDEKPGYCVTPKHTRWKKGAPSPNPRGRPPKPKTPDAIIEETSRALIAIKHNNKVIKVTQFEAMVRKLYASAFKGNQTAQSELLRMRLKYARADEKALDNDDVEHEFVLVNHDQEKLEEPKPKQERKPRSTIRSRQSETRRETFNRVSAFVVTVKASGVRRRMAFEYALWQMILAGALAGDIRATRLANRYMDDISEVESRKLQLGCDDDEVMTYTLDLGKLPGLDDEDEM